MKKLFFISFGILTLTSCKKDRVCTCSYQDGTVVSKTQYVDISKKDANALCVSNVQTISCTVQ